MDEAAKVIAVGVTCDEIDRVVHEVSGGKIYNIYNIIGDDEYNKGQGRRGEKDPKENSLCSCP